MKDFYTQLIERRKSWVPVCGNSTDVKPGAETTIGRALALRVLEIPVGAWIQDGCAKEVGRLPQSAIALLNLNQQDEVKHDKVLTMAAGTHQQYISAQDNRDAIALSRQWIEHPDHPIVKAAVLESSVFFVLLPILRFLGGPSLRTVSADISNDESLHVAVNRHIINELGYKWSLSLDTLRWKTVNWMVEELTAAGKWGRQQLWLESSDSLLERGLAPQLADTVAGRMPAFFETSNEDLPIYG